MLNDKKCYKYKVVGEIIVYVNPLLDFFLRGSIIFKFLFLNLNFYILGNSGYFSYFLD